MQLHIRVRAYHLLWKVMRKKMICIEGSNIEYVLLPWWLLISPEAKHFFGESMRIVHRPTKTVMIFVCASEKDKRYTIYHEHTEACYVLQQGFAENVESIANALRNASTEVFPDAPDLDAQLNEFLKRTDDRPHAVALLLELSLMKRELDWKEYHLQLEHALKNRL